MRRIITRIVVFLWVLSFAALAAAELPEGRIAHYTFDDTNKDILGISDDMILENTAYVNNTLYLNGLYFSEDDYEAQATIQDFYYNEFTVHVDFLPLEGDETQTGFLTGGRNYRWIGFYFTDTDLILYLNNKAFTHTFLGVVVERNQWHKIICAFDLGEKTVVTMLDGVLLETVNLPDDFTLNVIGSPGDVTDRRFLFTNYGNGGTFLGYVDNLIVFDRALSQDEIADVNDAYAGNNIPNNGIWKSADNLLSVYLQKYLEGSAVVIATLGDGNHTVFLDPDYTDGIQVDNDLYGGGYTLNMNFSSPVEGDIMVDLPGENGLFKNLDLVFGDLP